MNLETTENTEHTEKALTVDSVVRKPELLHEELTGIIRQTAFDIHRYFGCGFLEKVYENSLFHRLSKQGLSVDRQFALSVRDEDGTLVGQYFADLIVDSKVLVEIKAVSGLTSVHYAQVLNYLKTTDIRVGMLINFGHSRLQLKRFTRRTMIFLLFSSVCSVSSVVS